MPIEKTETQIRARVQKIENFIDGSIRTKSLNEERGISAVMGKLKTKPDVMTIQSYLFDLEKNWDMQKVRKWLMENKIVTMSEEEQTAETYAELRGVEILSTGDWNNTKFGETDIDKIIESFEKIGEKIKPFLKLGHAENQKLLQEDGYPAAGWVTNLRRVGEKLLADVRDVPRVIAELIEKKAYKRVSVELWKNYKATKEEAGEAKIFPWVLKAFSLLGGDTPAVTNLADVLALYVNDSDQKTENYIYEFAKEEKQMAEENKEDKKEENENTENKEEHQCKKENDNKEELEKIKNELYAERKKYERFEKIIDKLEDADKLAKFIEETEQTKTECELAKKQAEEIINGAKIKEVNDLVEKLMSDNKILPAQKELAQSLLTNAQKTEGVIKFSKDLKIVGIKEEMNNYDALKAFIESFPKLDIFSEHSSAKKFTGNSDQERQSEVEKYRKEHNCSYGDAQLRVKQTRPELFV